MFRHILAAGIAILAVLVFSMGPAKADRLGGAYRGPYNDRQTPKDTENPEVTAQTSGEGNAPPDAGSGDSGENSGSASAGSGNEGEGNEGNEGEGNEGEGESGPAVGTGDDGSSGSESGPPTGEGSSTPSGPSLGGSGFGSGPGGKTAVEDVLAYWPFWFEHNKEWILAGILKERDARSRTPPGSSVALFVTGAGEARKRTPVTDDQKMDQIYPVLVQSLTHESEWVRDAAVLALGKLGAAEGIEHLAARLHDPQPDVREDALLALGLTGRKEALTYLMEALKGSDRDLKAYAALGLGLLGIRDVVPAMLTEYNQLSRDPRAEEAAACLAVSIGLLGDETVVDALGAPIARRGSSKRLKIHVCQALSRIGGESARKWLIRAMDHKDDKVQAAAILALGNYPSADVIRKLLRKGLSSGKRMTKLFSVVSLGRIGKSLLPSDRVYRTLVKDLKEIAVKPQKDKYTAMYASLSLAIMGNEAANDFFLEMLGREHRKKHSKEVHSAMAMALGLLEERAAVRDLREIVRRAGLEDDYRGYSALALGIMGDEKSKATILDTVEDDKNRSDLVRSCCWALGLLGGEKEVPVLIDILQMEGGDKHQVRGAAAIALGLIGDASAVKPLLKIARDDPENSNRAFAIAALGCMIDKDPVPRIPQLFMNVHYREELPIVTEVLRNL